MSRFFPYMHEGPRTLSELSEGQRINVTRTFQRVGTILGDAFTGDLSHESVNLADRGDPTIFPADVSNVMLRLHNRERHTLLLMKARLVLGRIAAPVIHMVGLNGSGAAEIHKYQAYAASPGVVRHQLL